MQTFYQTKHLGHCILVKSNDTEIHLPVRIKLGTIMSALLQSNWHFINLLLSTDYKQQKVILNNLTPHQVDLLTEIFHNLVHVVDLNDVQGKYVKRNLKTLKLLGKLKRNRKTRNSSIKKHSKVVVKALEVIGFDLLNAGKHYKRMQDAC